jgi:hypothetical protein
MYMAFGASCSVAVTLDRHLEGSVVEEETKQMSWEGKERTTYMSRRHITRKVLPAVKDPLTVKY